MNESPQFTADIQIRNSVSLAITYNICAPLYRQINSKLSPKLYDQMVNMSRTIEAPLFNLKQTVMNNLDVRLFR